MASRGPACRRLLIIPTTVTVTCVLVVLYSVPSLPVDAGRANLLADIRGFKKTKLTRASERKIKKKKKKKHEDVVDSSAKVPGSGGDLMSDLAAKLQMRRKGISGGAGKTGTGNGGGGASDMDTGRRAQNPMDRVSKLIPPPPPKPIVDLSSSRDDDWLDS